MELLLIEDDVLLGQGIETAMQQMGYRVEWMKDGISGLAALRQLSPDVVILDLNLPGLHGIEVLRQCREYGIQTPVLILTAQDGVEDRVRGLDAGADDYLLKPFAVAELEARVRALQRRAAGRADGLIRYKDLVIDTLGRSVTRNDEPVVLPRREFELLQRLVEHCGTVLTRRRLIEMLYGMDEEVESNALEVHIHSLRKKFGKDLIRTLRGVGYLVEKA